MAHELDFTRGEAAFVARGEREDVWHRYGTYVGDRVLTPAEALELAHLDYTVDKRPTRYLVQVPGQADEWRDSDRAFVTVRNDSQAELGAVGPDYQPLQNADAFKVLGPMIDGGLVTIETAGAVRGGADVFLLVKFNVDLFGPVVREVFTDEVIPYGLFSNNHNGRRKAILQETPVRVVCANTLGMAHTGAETGRNRSVEVRHTINVEAKLVEAAQTIWGAIIERYETVAKQYRTLKGFYLDEAMFRELVVDVALPDPRKHKKFNPEAKLAEMVVARYQQKVGEITRLWTEGAGHTGDHTAWEAYQGLVEAVDHNEVLWPNRGGTFGRAQSLLDGTLGNIKQDVLNGLVKAAR